MIKNLFVFILFNTSYALYAMDEQSFQLTLDASFLDIATCLHACTTGDVPTAKRYFEEGGVDPKVILDSKIAKSKNSTFLHLSVEHPEIVQLLLEKQVLVNAQHDWGWTPLYAAVSELQPKSVELLLAHGADPLIVNHLEATPLHKITLLASTGFGGQFKHDHDGNKIAILIIRALKAKGDYTQCYCLDDTDNTPLHYAARANVFVLTQTLMPHGMPEYSAAASRQRLLTFFCWSRTIFPREITLYILSHLALDCEYAGLRHLVNPSEKNLIPHLIHSMQQLAQEMKAAMCEDERVLLHQALVAPNPEKQTPMQRANATLPKVLLDPKTWQLQ